MSDILLDNNREALTLLCEEFRNHNQIPPEAFEEYRVKRGLRNADGTGVMAGLTTICNVHGYLIDDGERVPDHGKLTYRGIDINDIVEGCTKDNRFGFEEVVWLLLFGTQPNQSQLDHFSRVINAHRELPIYFAEDMILKAPSANIMNKLARSVLALYSYDDNPEDNTLENNILQAIQLIAHLPSIMTYAYQVKRRHFDKESMYFHQLNPNHSTAESILNAIHPDQKFTDSEAKLLDVCLMLHAEHGGGNNSTFTCRVLSSSGTDIYSSIAGAIGSLKGPKHGGANHRVMTMMKGLMETVQDWNSDDEISAYLERIVRKEAGDRSGLIYGMGHAVYTLSDPRAVILKKKARDLAVEKGEEWVRKFDLFQRVERLSPDVFHKVKGQKKVISANVDFYSGLVYAMLGISSDLYTPLFAVSRIAGWCAHRIEEIMTGGRIIRPAYRSMIHGRAYVPLSDRI